MEKTCEELTRNIKENLFKINVKYSNNSMAMVRLIKIIDREIDLLNIFYEEKLEGESYGQKK